MKKILKIILASLVGIVILFILVFMLINFPFIFIHSETKITKEDKLKIEQYTIDTFGEKLDFVRYDRYSNTGGVKEKFAIYRVNNREFEVGLYINPMKSSNKDWQFYDTFVDDYIEGIDENLTSQVPSQLKEAYPNSRINYFVYYDSDNEKKHNTNARLNQYKKDIKKLTREEILYREKDNIEVTYRAVLSPESHMEDFETSIYELYKVMKSSGMGKIDILIEFGEGNYQTGKFHFEKECDYPVHSPKDLKQFYEPRD